MAKSKPQKRDHRPFLSKRYLTVAQGIAGMFMFLSWIGEHVYFDSWTSRRSEVEQRAQFVNGEMAKAQMWLLAFQTERRKGNPDPELILNSVTSYAEVVGSIVQAALDVDPDSKVLQRHSSDFRRLDEPLRAGARARDLGEIQRGADAMMLWFKSIGPEAHEAINNAYTAVRQAQDQGAWWFKALFVGASVIGAFTWIMSRRVTAGLAA